MTHCRGQAYDGAANMAGAINGCAAIIRRQYPLAIRQHCRSHVLNLSVMKSATSCPEISKFSPLWFCLHKVLAWGQQKLITLPVKTRKYKITTQAQISRIKYHFCYHLQPTLQRYIIACYFIMLSPVCQTQKDTEKFLIHLIFVRKTRNDNFCVFRYIRL